MLFFIYIVVMMMPFQVTLLPQYIVSRDWGIYDTPAALILTGIFSAFGTFILTQILKIMPDDMIEAAKLETGSTLRLLWYVVLPNLRGGIVCLFVLQFTELWNMVAEPLVLMETELKMPLAAMHRWFWRRQSCFCSCRFYCTCCSRTRFGRRWGVCS